MGWRTRLYFFIFNFQNQTLCPVGCPHSHLHFGCQPRRPYGDCHNFDYPTIITQPGASTARSAASRSRPNGVLGPMPPGPELIRTRPRGRGRHRPVSGAATAAGIFFLPEITACFWSPLGDTTQVFASAMLEIRSKHPPTHPPLLLPVHCNNTQRRLSTAVSEA